MGRPCKLTPEVQERVCAALRAGNYYEAAAACAGVTYWCLRKWMQQGKRARSGRYFQFFQAATQAEADAEATIVAQWRAQIPDNWPAARDFLARRFPDRWGPKERQEITGKGGKALDALAAFEQLARGGDAGPPGPAEADPVRLRITQVLDDAAGTADPEPRPAAAGEDPVAARDAL
jgi:hypothetical protein